MQVVFNLYEVPNIYIKKEHFVALEHVGICWCLWVWVGTCFFLCYTWFCWNLLTLKNSGEGSFKCETEQECWWQNFRSFIAQQQKRLFFFFFFFSKTDKDGFASCLLWCSNHCVYCLCAKHLYIHWLNRWWDLRLIINLVLRNKSPAAQWGYSPYKLFAF